jgi:tetratricopeptide (TPR) repeat protein
VLVLAWWGIALARPTGAQTSAAAAERSSVAHELTTQALECLRRGEDATDPEQKLAAYREGLALARQAVAIEETNADAHFAIFANMGRVMLLEGVTANPLSLFTVNRELDRVLEINPNHSDALGAKGGMYRQLPRLLGGSLTKAEDYLQRAIKNDPNAVGARIELAETYRDMGQPQRGMPLLHEAAELAQRLDKRRQLKDAQRLLAEMDE